MSEIIFNQFMYIFTAWSEFTNYRVYLDTKARFDYKDLEIQLTHFV